MQQIKQFSLDAEMVVIVVVVVKSAAEINIFLVIGISQTII